MIIDSDRDKPHKLINATKRRLQGEFDKGPGHAWITDGREIENYLPAQQVQAALRAVCPKSTPTSGFGRYENALRLRGLKGSETHAPKVDIARYIVENCPADLSVLDLRSRINKLRAFVHESNPTSSRR